MQAMPVLTVASHSQKRTKPMFIVFVVRVNPETVYITTKEHFGQLRQELQVTLTDIVWNKVTLESLIMLKDKQSNFLCLTAMTQPIVL